MVGTRLLPTHLTDGFDGDSKLGGDVSELYYGECVGRQSGRSLGGGSWDWYRHIVYRRWFDVVGISIKTIFVDFFLINLVVQSMLDIL